MEITQTQTQKQNAQFEITIDGSILKDMVNYLSKINDEAIFNISEETIETRVIDPSNVILVNMTIEKWACDTWRIDKAGDIGIDAYRLARILRSFKKPKKKDWYTNGLVTLNKKEQEEKLVIEFQNKKFVIQTLTLEKENLPQLDIDYEYSVTISLSDLKDAIKQAKDVSETLIIRVEDGSLKVIVEDVDNGTRFEQTIYQGYGGITVESRYNIDMLSKLTNLSTSNFEEVRINLSTDMPLKLSFSNEYDNVHLTSFLAPRIKY